jgi:hypothetical protein
MTKRTRTILFFICLFLFFLITPFIVLYSQGYRIDWNLKKIIKTGGFYFKVWPEGTQVFIDGKFQKKTAFLSNSVYINNLTPKEYKVEIKKEGFQSWQKNLEIKDNWVTTSDIVILIPENPKFVNLSQKVEDFFFSPDQRKLIIKEDNNKGWGLKIIEFPSFSNQEKYPENNLFSGFQSTDVELLDLKFSQDSNRILLTTREKENVRYWILELRSPLQEQTPDDLISLDFLGNETEEVSFNPQDAQKIFSIKKTSLFNANIVTKIVDLNPLLKNIISYEISEGKLFRISNDGSFFRTDLVGGNEEKLNSDPFSIKKDKKYQIYVKSPLFFLKEDEVLYILKPDSTAFEKISESVKDIKFSPDGKKMLYFNNYEIGVLFLEKKESQPQKEALENLFLTRLSEKINQVSWLNSNYFLFTVGNKVKISETDGRDRINIYDFAEFNSPKIFFNQFDKKLYILSEGNLSSSEKLLP